MVLRLRSRRYQQTYNTKPLDTGHLLEFHALVNHLDKPLFQTVNLGNFLISLFFFLSTLRLIHEFHRYILSDAVQGRVILKKSVFVLIVAVFI